MTRPSGFSATHHKAFEIAAKTICRLFAEPKEGCACMTGKSCTASKNYYQEAAVLVAAFERNGLLKFESGNLVAGEQAHIALNRIANAGAITDEERERAA